MGTKFRSEPIIGQPRKTVVFDFDGNMLEGNMKSKRAKKLVSGPVCGRMSLFKIGSTPCEKRKLER